MSSPKEKIAWFASWPDSQEKIDQINTNAALLRKNGWEVGLVTQYPKLNAIDFSGLDHVVFDNTNEMYFSETKSFKFGFNRIIPSCSEMRQDCGDWVFVDNKARAPHVYSVYRLYSVSMHLSSGYGYKVYAYFEADFNGTQKLCDGINQLANDIIQDELNFVGFDSSNREGGMNACLFLGPPQKLSSYFPMHSVKTEDDFFRHYQNESVEDSLVRFFKGDPNSKIYTKEEVVNFLGGYGKDWDTSHAGLDWIEEASTRVLSAFTTNAPFLKSSENGFSLFYLFKQELILKEVIFKAKVTLSNESGNRVLFDETASLPFNHYRFFVDLSDILFDEHGSIRVETETSCGDSVLREDYSISLSFKELTGYYKIRHIE